MTTLRTQHDTWLSGKQRILHKPDDKGPAVPNNLTTNDEKEHMVSRPCQEPSKTPAKLDQCTFPHVRGFCEKKAGPPPLEKIWERQTQ
jgi:hypothetical protein